MTDHHDFDKNYLEINDGASITVIADISGSMSGSSVHELKSTLSKFINNLPSNFLLNITADNLFHPYTNLLI